MFFGNRAEQPIAKAQAKPTTTSKQQSTAGSDSLSPETANSGGLSRSSSLSDRLKSSWKGGVSSLLKKSQDNVRADAPAKARRSREGKVTAVAEPGQAAAAKSKGKDPVELPAPEKLRTYTTDSHGTTNSSVVDPVYSPNAKRFRALDNPPPVPSKSPPPQETSFFDDSSSDEDDQSPVLQRASSVRVGKPTLVRHTSNVAPIHAVKHEHSPMPLSGLSQRSIASENRADTSDAVSQSATVQDAEEEPTSQVSSSWGQGPEDALSRLEGTKSDSNHPSPQLTTKPLPLTPASSIPAAQYSPSRPLVASPSTYSTYSTTSAPHRTPTSIASSPTLPTSDTWAPTPPPTAHQHQTQPIPIPFPTPLSPLSALHSNPVSPSTASAAATALNSPISRLSRALSAPTHPGMPPNRNPNRRVTIRPSDLVIVHSEHDHRLFRESVVTTPYPEKGASSDQEGFGDGRYSGSTSLGGRSPNEPRVGRSRSVGGAVGLSSGRSSGRGGRRTNTGNTESGSSVHRGAAPSSKNTVSGSGKNRLSDISDDDASHRSAGEQDHRRDRDHDDGLDGNDAEDSDVPSPSRPGSASTSAAASDDDHPHPRHPHRHTRHSHQQNHIDLHSTTTTPLSPHGPGSRDRFPSLSSSTSLFLELNIAGRAGRSTTVEIEVPPHALASLATNPTPDSSAAEGAAVGASHGSIAAAAAAGKGVFASLRTRSRPSGKGLFGGNEDDDDADADASGKSVGKRTRKRLSKHRHLHPHPTLSSPTTTQTPPFDDAHLFALLRAAHQQHLLPTPLHRLLALTRTLSHASPSSADTHALDSAAFVAHLRNPSLGEGRRGWLLWLRNQQGARMGGSLLGEGEPQGVVGSSTVAVGVESPVSATPGRGAMYPRVPFQRGGARGGAPPGVVLAYRFRYRVIASAVLGWLVVGTVVVVVWVLVGVPGARVGAGGARGELGMEMGELRATGVGAHGAVHGSGYAHGEGDWRVDSQMRVLTGLVLGGGVSVAGLVVTGLWVLGGWILL